MSEQNTTIDAGALARAHIEQLEARVKELETALRKIEMHHVALNRQKGRDERRSTTLHIARSVLLPATAAEEMK